jgi:hypothetical protein
VGEGQLLGTAGLAPTLEAAAARYSEQVAYAKLWREKVEASRLRRSKSVALKPKMFSFSEGQAGQDDSANFPMAQQQQQHIHASFGAQGMAPHQLGGSSNHFGADFSRGGPSVVKGNAGARGGYNSTNIMWG